MRVPERLGPTKDEAARCGLKHSAIVAAFLAVAISVLSACPALLAFALDPPRINSEVHAAASKPACPARDFRSFVAAFAESEAIQRQYTRLPLVHGRLDLDQLGTDKEFTRKRISSFDKIPFRDPKDDYRIFPSNAKTKEWRFEIKIGTAARYPGSKTIVTLGMQDTGFRVYYRFIRSDDCWTLIGIDDEST